ncbi:hypothetical protein Tco_1505745 [Tanacetum coccineum]
MAMKLSEILEACLVDPTGPYGANFTAKRTRAQSLRDEMPPNAIQVSAFLALWGLDFYGTFSSSRGSKCHRFEAYSGGIHTLGYPGPQTFPRKRQLNSGDRVQLGS